MLNLQHLSLEVQANNSRRTLACPHTASEICHAGFYFRNQGRQDKHLKLLKLPTFCCCVMFIASISSEFIIFKVGTSSQPSSNKVGSRSLRTPFPTKSSTEKEAIFFRETINDSCC